jgi:hypothetical protein
MLGGTVMKEKWSPKRKAVKEKLRSNVRQNS